MLRKLALLLLAGGVALKVVCQAPIPSTPEMEKKIDSIISQMSVDDKLTLIGGEDNFYTRAIPSVHIPRFKMTDGPVGTRTFGPSTAYTAGVALAASWDTELAEKVGASLGEDARARGVNFLLAPGVNIYRSPLNGRNMEYFGEDPYLAGRIATGYILGVQSKGVSATVKHFAANNSEYDRHRINSVIDERTLREIYLPAFEAAVKDGHVGAVMDSYNLINGEHATQNNHLNNEILKGEWAFKGTLMSDWNATYDAVGAANGGLDLEMPYAKLMTPEAMKAALASGTVKMATLDDKVRRILRTAMQFGWMDRNQWITSIPQNNMAADAVALQEARESITLLKNSGHLLPLSASKMKTIAVLGPQAAEAVVGGGGSSNTTPFFADSFSVGLAKYLGDSVKVLYVPSVPDTSQLASRTKWDSLTLSIQHNGKDAGTRTPRAIASSARDGGVTFVAEGKGATTYRWKGKYSATESAPYLVMLNVPDPDSYQVKVNGEQVLSHAAGSTYRTGHQRYDAGSFHLEKGAQASVEVEYTTEGAMPHLDLAILQEGDMLPAESRQILQSADAVLVTTGFDKAYEGEGFDRTYRMPGVQHELIEQVAGLNPHTIVAVTGGGAVETAPWIDKVSAMLTVYYPGQEGARALSEILFGARSPEGHLPFSWERVLSDNPTSSHYEEEPGADRAVHYGEGLYVGYRYYTSMDKTPLFPFGYGLSYTTFVYTHLTVEKKSADDVVVGFDVQNTGNKGGATVAQVYVGDPSATVKRPVMELKGFSKVYLNAGEKTHVVLHLNQRAFEYYDVASKGWKMDPGEFTILLGESSDKIEAKASIKM